jgi:hypothetical protein
MALAAAVSRSQNLRHPNTGHIKILPHLLRPARGGALAVVVTFALLLTLAGHAGLFGVPLAFILISWLFKYAYILFDYSAWGIHEPPALDIQMLNPVEEQRPLAQLAILGLIYGAVKLVEVELGSPVAMALAAAAALLIPASVAYWVSSGTCSRRCTHPCSHTWCGVSGSLTS